LIPVLSGEPKEIASIKNLDKTKSSTALIPYSPYLSIHIPTLIEIRSRILTSIFIDLPWYTIKQMYKAPIPTAIILYVVLPQSIWLIIGPRVLYWLPGLL
jgi:hypothetical protein